MTVEERLERMERMLQALLERERRPRRADAQLLGKREVARILGVDRSKVLDPLIAQGRIHTVPKGRRVAIPRSEVERLLAEGVPDPTVPKRRRAPPPPRRALVDPEAARRLRLEDLG